MVQLYQKFVHFDYTCDLLSLHFQMVASLLAQEEATHIRMPPTAAFIASSPLASISASSPSYAVSYLREQMDKALWIRHVFEDTMKKRGIQIHKASDATKVIGTGAGTGGNEFRFPSLAEIARVEEEEKRRNINTQNHYGISTDNSNININTNGDSHVAGSQGTIYPGINTNTEPASLWDSSQLDNSGFMDSQYSLPNHGSLSFDSDLMNHSQGQAMGMGMDGSFDFNSNSSNSNSNYDPNWYSNSY